MSARAAEPQRQPTVVLDDEPVSARVGGRPLRHDPLIAVRRAAARRLRVVPGHRDPRGHGEAAAQAQRSGVGDGDVRSERQHLTASGILAVHRRVDDGLFHPRAFGVAVAVDDAHDVGAISRRGAADHERDRVAGLRREVIRVADDPHAIEAFLRGRLHLRRLRAPASQRDDDA